ncbi:hypothetical protein ACOMHN_014082 [Nucella lapillus]
MLYPAHQAHNGSFVHSVQLIAEPVNGISRKPAPVCQSLLHGAVDLTLGANHWGDGGSGDLLCARGTGEGSQQRVLRATMAPCSLRLPGMAPLIAPSLYLSH